MEVRCAELEERCSRQEQAKASTNARARVSTKVPAQHLRPSYCARVRAHTRSFSRLKAARLRLQQNLEQDADEHAVFMFGYGAQ